MRTSFTSKNAFSLCKTKKCAYVHTCACSHDYGGFRVENAHDLKASGKLPVPALFMCMLRSFRLCVCEKISCMYILTLCVRNFRRGAP